MARITFDLTYHKVLLGTAEAQADEAQHPIAIVTAQIAFEVRVESAFTELLPLHANLPVETIIALLPDRTFMQPAVRDLWLALTGDRISKAPAWKAYTQHVARRNRLAHGSEAWSSHAEAEESLKAVRAMIEHIDAVEEQVLKAEVG